MKQRGEPGSVSQWTSCLLDEVARWSAIVDVGGIECTCRNQPYPGEKVSEKPN